MTSEEIITTLRKCSVFNELSVPELTSIAAMGVFCEFQAGEKLYDEGSTNNNLYVLAKGQVSLLRKSQLNDGRTAYTTVYVVRELPQRRMIGGWCSLIGRPHVQMCTARCEKPSLLVSLDSDGVREIMMKNPPLRIKILEQLVLILRDRIESSYAAMETL